MLKITLIKFEKYLLIILNVVEEDGVSCSENKSIRKSENELVEILANLESGNLPKFKNSITIQSTSTT